MYRIPDSVLLEVPGPCERAMSADGLAYVFLQVKATFPLPSSRNPASLGVGSRSASSKCLEDPDLLLYSMASSFVEV